jgi:hypothetical protein
MMLGFRKLKVTAGIKNIKSRPIEHAQPIQLANPVRTFLLSGFPSPVKRFLTHRDLYEVTGSSRDSVRFQS